MKTLETIRAERQERERRIHVEQQRRDLQLLAADCAMRGDRAGARYFADVLAHGERAIRDGASPLDAFRSGAR